MLHNPYKTAMLPRVASIRIDRDPYLPVARQRGTALHYHVLSRGLVALSFRGTSLGASRSDGKREQYRQNTSPDALHLVLLCQNVTVHRAAANDFDLTNRATRGSAWNGLFCFIAFREGGPHAPVPNGCPQRPLISAPKENVFGPNLGCSRIPRILPQVGQ